ncbi:MAG: hypothetical protein MJA28_05430 [Gammaproteobacteria bacterium]|nr:hypothetical protein [Gammaproteobacteria bacterium]
MPRNAVKTQRVYHTVSAVCLSLTVAFGASFANAARDDFLEQHRLFMQPGERDKLDQVRAKNFAKEQKSPPKKTIVKKAVPVPPVKVQGFIQRSDGKTTTWLNDQNTLESRTVDKTLNVGKSPDASGRVRVKLPNGKTITLKPGQTYDPKTGQIKQVY